MKSRTVSNYINNLILIVNYKGEAIIDGYLKQKAQIRLGFYFLLD